MTLTVLVERTERKQVKTSSRDLSFAMMGKSQKLSRGYSSGFVPDYRHAVETVGESEGLGSSGRADSENSSALKRKCISLNVDKYEGFNVPKRVISLSKILGSERKELEMRLRSELQQIQMLQKRIISSNMKGNGRVSLSSTSNGHAKKRDSMGYNLPQLKRDVSGRFESAKPAQPPWPVSSSDVLLMKQCEQILNRLMIHQYAWVINTPVDVVSLNIPDYHTVIKHPMDLGTVKSKLASGSYSNPWGFVADVRLTFTNAMTYNPPSNDVHIMADQMSKWFEQRWKPIEKKLAAADSSLKRERETEAAEMLPQSKKRKASPANNKVVVPERAKPRMTVKEKQSLSRCLVSLIAELPEHIIDFLKRHSDDANQDGEDEIEIDIDSLGDDTLFELRKLLDDHLREKQTGHQKKAEACEMEILNESGLSNSSMHPCKGNEPVDEDVDIGGNDPPISNYPPVEIEKDAVPRNSKHSSSSNSSSDSGSSSSDSDSGSSSGSESDGRVASPTRIAKGSAGCEVTMDQDKSDVMNPLDINRTVSGPGNGKEDVHDRPFSVETDGRTEGESVPSERQISPKKLQRAALLRGRFADTILKAREKTLVQIEKGDPEKLQKEREDLERQQREERAWLQAEAKAAEEARRQAEAEAAAEAAAEAKRKRELEREAARQALLKIEKTVEINENSLILEDLEMLRSIPGEHVPSSVDETSPGGSNPLEKLGLYMKVDDEEEDDTEPSSIPANDVEEGEID